VVETSALEKGMRDHKWYAAGVGLVQDHKGLIDYPKEIRVPTAPAKP
jgi:hypothetical protein